MKNKITSILTYTSLVISILITLLMLVVCVFHFINTPFVFPKIFMTVVLVGFLWMTKVFFDSVKFLKEKTTDAVYIKKLRRGITTIAVISFIFGSSEIAVFVGSMLLLQIFEYSAFSFLAVGAVFLLFFIDCIFILERIKMRERSVSKMNVNKE